MALFADIATGNSYETEVLDGTCCDLEGDIQVSPGTRAEAVDKLLNGSLVGGGGTSCWRTWSPDFFESEESEDFDSDGFESVAGAFFLP